MQKISSYLYPNRVELIADLTSFNVEFTNVYQRNITIYNGINNTIEFDIKNADQKRLDLTSFTRLDLNVMDASGNALTNSPYPIEPTNLKGIGKSIIPELDLVNLSAQYLKYSVSGVKDGDDVLLYTNSSFGAVGTIKLEGDAVPTFRDPLVYNTFISEVDGQGVPIWHSPAIPLKYYEANATDEVRIDVQVTGFTGTIWLDATTDDTINVESFRKAGKPFGSWTQNASDGLFTGVVPYATNIPIGNYSHFRVSFQTHKINGIGATFIVTKTDDTYDVKVKSYGTGYAPGSLIKIPGSHLGGIDNDNDIIITVVNVGNTSVITSSYSVGSVGRIIWTGTPSSGTGTYDVTGTNYSGVVNNITVL